MMPCRIFTLFLLSLLVPSSCGTDLLYNSYRSVTNSHRRLIAVDVPFIPDLREQSKGEENYLKLHKCRDNGEAYSAAYLITREHLIYQNTAYNLSWVNCEMGSFIMMNGRANMNREDVNGTVIQTLDVLDYSVIHLSAFERLQRRWQCCVPKGTMKPGSIASVTAASELLERRTKKLREIDKIANPSVLYTRDLNRTVVIMPFLLGDMGAGHSILKNRLDYLQACFWSIYAHYPHITATVKSERDREYVLKNMSFLPFFDVILSANLPKSASLPVSTVQQAKARLMDGRWDFDFIYFTESDQILLMKSPEVLYDHLRKYPRRIILPHRLMAYPEAVVKHYHKRSLSTYGDYDWVDMQCCLPRQNCYGSDRKTKWVKVSNASVPIINIYGIQTPLGQANFHEETYRACKLNPAGGWPYCP